jgi:ABC-2 type transport system permease protein
VVIHARFNPNLDSSWFNSVMQVNNSITMLTVILTGAALIPEREQGTVEHLLIMPIVPTEIMLAKIVANGLVVVVAASLSLLIFVRWGLKVPIVGSVMLFLSGAALYAFTVAALGILLGTVAATIGQFGLLAIPVLVVMQLLSGSCTPLESMPVWLQYAMQLISPTPHFVSFSQAVLYRGADLSIVWLGLAAIAAIGSVYFGFCLARFRSVIFGD